MSDNRPVFLIPVDPKAYGLGMALGCLIKFWPIFVIIGIIIYGVSFIWQVGEAVVSYPENVRQTSVVATENIIYQNTQSVYQDQIIEGLANLQSYQGILDISAIIYAEGGGMQATVKYVEFTSDGFKVFVDSVISNPNENTPDESCILFYPKNNNEYHVNPSYSDFQELNDIPGNKHLVGYAFYPRVCTKDSCPYSHIPYRENRYIEFPIIPEKYETILQTLHTNSSTIYFQHGCSAFVDPIKLFDYADFANR